MAPRLSETTVAAPRTPILRASVNAERGGDQRIAKCALQQAVKIGNATHKRVEEAWGDVPFIPREMAAAHRNETGGVGCKGKQRPSTRDDIARHFDGQC